MLFYCPNCRRECESQPENKIVTKSGRVAYKAVCPVCGMDMAEFIPGEKAEVSNQQPEKPTGQ